VLHSINGSEMSHSCDEYYAVYLNKRVKARKAHRCDACGDTIDPGHFYHRVSWVFDGSANSVKRCLRCEAIHKHLRGKAPGETWPSERLDCGETYEDHWGGPPPENIARLAFLTGKDLQDEPQAVLR
jgi:hypothetical protein